MVKQVEAIFEDGVLRPLEPLSLAEHQRVVVTIDTGEAPAAKPYNDRKAESAWLAAHRDEYRGQWLALDGDRLLSHGLHGRSVHEAARRQGVQLPLLVHIPEDYDLPSAGLLQI